MIVSLASIQPLILPSFGFLSSWQCQWFSLKIFFKIFWLYQKNTKNKSCSNTYHSNLFIHWPVVWQLWDQLFGYGWTSGLPCVKGEFVWYSSVKLGTRWETSCFGSMGHILLFGLFWLEFKAPAFENYYKPAPLLRARVGLTFLWSLIVFFSPKELLFQMFIIIVGIFFFSLKAFFFPIMYSFFKEFFLPSCVSSYSMESSCCSEISFI